MQYTCFDVAWALEFWRNMPAKAHTLSLDTFTLLLVYPNLPLSSVFSFGSYSFQCQTKKSVQNSILFMYLLHITARHVSLSYPN